VHVPFSGAIGQAIICGYGRLWNVQCADDERVTALNLSIRYLCAANPAAQSMECADRNMVGTAAVLTIAAGLIAAAAAWVDARRPRNGGAAVSALARYGICAATSLLMLWQLSRVVLPTIWIGSLDERIIASRPILAFTGSVIGYGLLIALAAIGLAGAAAAALARMRR
jgi:O-antigen ligase